MTTTGLVRSELLRLRTTRSLVGLAAGLVAYPFVTGVWVATLPEADRATLDAGTLVSVVRGVGDMGLFVGVVAGIVAVAGAYRHHTIASSLLVTPDRKRLVAAQLGALALVGTVVAVTAVAVAVASGAWVLAAQGVHVDLIDTALVQTMAGAVVVTAAYTVIGGALGAVVTNPTPAIAGTLVWLFVIERALPIVLRMPGLRQRLPGAAADGLLQVAADVPGVLSPGAAVVALTTLVALLSLGATAATVRRDVA